MFEHHPPEKHEGSDEHWKKEILEKLKTIEGHLENMMRTADQIQATQTAMNKKLDELLKVDVVGKIKELTSKLKTSETALESAAHDVG